MFKRITWATVGYGVGVGSSIYVQRRVRRAVARYTPEHVRADLARRSRLAAERARTLGTDAAAAVREGRATMRSHEIELRDTYLGSGPPRRDDIYTR